MAQRPPEGSEKARLVAELEASRRALTEDLHTLSRAADLPSKIARSLTTIPVKVATGSAALGLISSLLIGGRKGPARHRKQPAPSLVDRLVAFARTQLTTNPTEEAEPNAPPAPQPPIDRAASLLETIAKALRRELK